ncbi:MAG TPA: 50S ribosomal protein L22 [Synergistaceae bacterium]|nr:50S ribosomal protein L22 [Synergistaceae bacterium]HPJ26729.1 50S ribosomal protein L22 [Synergistaceae bacterium]HPQ36787.1 50S ribosomal protein L22 [Synergistaceae bacterium]
MEVREARAIARQVRISPTKVRQVMRLITGKHVGDAMLALKYSPKKAARIVEKVLQSAVANADHNYGMDVENLVVAKAYADKGPVMKRFRPVSMGRAHPYRHQTSHVTVVVAER